MKKFQRDEFISEIYKAAKKNCNIYFLSADFGAPALDNFRKYLKNQFIHLGICEQNMVDFGCGLAIEKKKVYLYAMAPFLSLRCLEQHKTATCLINANVCSIVTGIGLSYANAGPTHYSTEDFACLRSLPNSIIYTASDPETAKKIAIQTLKEKTPVFVRLDRKSSYNLAKKTKSEEIKKGFRFLKKEKNKKILIIGQGTILERALLAMKHINTNINSKVTIIDIIRAKPFPNILKNLLNNYQKLIVIDEQTKPGGLASLILENIAYNKKIVNLCLPDKFIFKNLGRDKLLDTNGLSIKNIIKQITKKN